MNPHIFEQMRKTAGAENFYLSIKNAMWSERMSEERKQLCSVRPIVVIYCFFLNRKSAIPFKLLYQEHCNNLGLATNASSLSGILVLLFTQ